jgi:hypothetical protein
LIIKLDSEHGIGERFFNDPFYLNSLFFSHINSYKKSVRRNQRPRCR